MCYNVKVRWDDFPKKIPSVKLINLKTNYFVKFIVQD